MPVGLGPEHPGVVEELIAVRPIPGVAGDRPVGTDRLLMASRHEGLRGPLARGRRPVEAGRAEILVQVPDSHRGPAEPEIHADLLVQEVARRGKAVRAVHGRTQAGHHAEGRWPPGDPALHEPVLADGRARGGARGLAPGDDVDDAAHGVGAVQRRPGAGQQLDASDVLEGHGQIAVVVSRSAGSLMRTPSTSTRVWPNEAPRTLMSVCDPKGPRWRTQTPGSRRSASVTEATGTRCRSSAVTTARVRPTAPAVAGAAVPVTTMRSSTLGTGGWARAPVAPAAPRTTSTAAATSHLANCTVPVRYTQRFEPGRACP